MADVADFWKFRLRHSGALFWLIFGMLGSEFPVQMSWLIFGKSGSDILMPLSHLICAQLRLDTVVPLGWLICGRLCSDILVPLRWLRHSGTAELADFAKSCLDMLAPLS